MRDYSNIEKHPFNRGHYIGYSHGRVFKITGQDGAWVANQTGGAGMQDCASARTIKGETLAKISAELEGFPKPEFPK